MERIVSWNILLPTTTHTMDLANILARLKAHPGDPSVTITTSAARTYMDAGLVREHLKELQRKAEQLLLLHYDKHVATPVIERARKVVAEIGKVDDRPGMAIFVNKDVGETVHLPFTVSERVTVGASFFLRDLMRAGLDGINYHVLLLSTRHARLFEAHDAHLIKEVKGTFPIENRHYTTDSLKSTNAKGQDDQQRRFHQQLDEAVRQVAGPQGVVVVASVADHYGHFVQAVAKADIYHGNLKGNFDHTPERDMIARAWEIMHNEKKQRDLAELEDAANGSTTLFNTSMEEIGARVTEGRGHVLFVERDLHRAAVIEGDRAVQVDENADHAPGIDLVDAIIEEQIAHGGEIRIVPNGSMDKYGGIALKLRY